MNKINLVLILILVCLLVSCNKNQLSSKSLIFSKTLSSAELIQGFKEKINDQLPGKYITVHLVQNGFDAELNLINGDESYNVNIERAARPLETITFKLISTEFSIQIKAKDYSNLGNVELLVYELPNKSLKDKSRIIAEACYSYALLTSNTNGYLCDKKLSIEDCDEMCLMNKKKGYALHASKIFHNIGEEFQSASSLYLAGLISFVKNYDLEKSLVYLNSAHHKFEELNLTYYSVMAKSLMVDVQIEDFRSSASFDDAKYNNIKTTIKKQLDKLVSVNAEFERAWLQNLMASLFFYNDELTNAEIWFNKAIKTAHDSGWFILGMTFSKNGAETYKRGKDYEVAKNYYLNIVKVLKEKEMLFQDKHLYKLTLEGLGNTYTHLGEWDNALITLSKIIGLTTKLSNISDQLRIQIKFGILFLKIGNHDRAQLYYNKAYKEMCKDYGNIDECERSNAKENIEYEENVYSDLKMFEADILLSQGNYKDSSSIYNRLISHQDSLIWQFPIHLKLASLYLTTQNLKKAKTEVDWLAKSINKENHDLWWLTKMLHLELKRKSKSENYFKEVSIDSFPNIDDREKLTKNTILKVLLEESKFFELKGDLNQALEKSSHIMKLLLSIRGNSNIKEIRYNFWNLYSNALVNHQDLVFKNSKLLINTTERQKFLKSSFIELDNFKGITLKEDILSDNQTVTINDSDSEDDLMTRLMQTDLEGENFDINSHTIEFDLDSYLNFYTSTTIISYDMKGEFVYAWVLSNNKIDLYKLGKSQRIRDKIDEYYQYVSKRPFKYSNKFEVELSELLISPIADHINTKGIVIIPDGNIQKVPFSSLRLNKKYMYEMYNINYSPSLHVLESLKIRKSKRPENITETTLFMAYDTHDQNSDAAINGTKQEFLSVSTLFKSKNVLAMTHPFKTKSIFDKLQSQYFSYVHFATHAENNYSFPSLSSLKFTNNKNVYAKDISKINLQSELVVLSACETSNAKTNINEGYLGMPAAFLSAGSDSVLVSLWKVDDTATKELMAQFYDRIMVYGETKAQALSFAQAKIKSIEGWQQPYFWAGWQLVGLN